MGFQEWWETTIWKKGGVDVPMPPAFFKEIACAAWQASRSEAIRWATQDTTVSGPTVPKLTRDDIVHWPESEDGLRRLHEECVKIAKVWQGNTGKWYYYRGDDLIELGPTFNPLEDANHCKMVVDAMAKDGWRWSLGASEAGTYLVEFYRLKAKPIVAGVGVNELPSTDWVLKTCVAAVIARLTKKDTQASAGTPVVAS